MSYGALGGIGGALQDIGGFMLDRYSREEEEKSYMKRLAAAERAQDAREAADRQRQEELAKTTPVGPRKTFLSEVQEGPPELKYGKFNKFGDMIESGSANDFEKAEYRGGLLDAERARRDADDKIAREDRRFRETEAGRDRRANISANRTRGETQGPAPQLFQTPNGEQVWVRPGEPVPKGARRINPYTPTREDSQPTDPNAWLSQF